MYVLQYLENEFVIVLDLSIIQLSRIPFWIIYFDGDASDDADTSWDTDDALMMIMIFAVAAVAAVAVLHHDDNLVSWPVPTQPFVTFVLVSRLPVVCVGGDADNAAILTVVADSL